MLSFSFRQKMVRLESAKISKRKIHRERERERERDSEKYKIISLRG